MTATVATTSYSKTRTTRKTLRKETTNVNSQLGKRQMDSEEEPAYDGHHEPERNVRPRQQQQLSSGAATIADQLRLMEQLNRVAIGMGFRNAKEMVEMVFGGEAAPMMPPVAAPVSQPLAAYPPAPYHAPYDGGQGGYHPYLGYVNPSQGYGASTNPGAPKLLAAGSAQLTFVDESVKAMVVLLTNAVHAAQRIPNAMDGLSTVLVRDRMTFVNVTGEREKLEVCHYPRQLGRFPSFFDSAKQRDVVGAELIFRRIRPIDQSRFAKTITTLKEGGHAIWCGHPGIGKSTEANFVLLEFLRHLGDGEDSEWPTKVAHRVNRQLFLYTWNATAERVECDMVPGTTLGDVEDFSRFWEAQQMVTETKPPVLFLELAEREKDPIVSIPTFIALSSRMVKTTLKTIDKSRSCIFLLVRPHEPEEVLLMAKVMFEANSKQLCARLECEREWDKVVEVLSDRMGIVGPLVRQVFSRQSAFDEYVEDMEDIATEVVRSTDISRLTKFRIPPALQCFVAPYPLDPKKSKKTSAFKFLSDHAASLLANSAMAPEFLIYAAVHGLEYQFTETFLRTVLLRDSNAPKLWQMTSWEWHSDPTYKRKLSERTTVAIFDTPLVKSCGRLVKFEGMHYNGDAQELDGDTLYLSQTINFCLGEMFTAVRENGRTVAINMFQTTTVSLPDHPFTVDTLETIMEKFGLFKKRNANVTLNLICLVDNSRVNVKGLKFKDNGKAITAKELCQDYPKVGKRLKTFVVRAGIYNVDRTAIASRPMAELAIPKPVDLLMSEKKSDLIAMAQDEGITGAQRTNKNKLAVKIREARKKAQSAPSMTTTAGTTSSDA